MENQVIDKSNAEEVLETEIIETVIAPAGERALEALQAALDMKALDIRALDVAEVCSFAQAFLVVSGTSERHIKGISDRIQERLRSKYGEQSFNSVGKKTSDWIIIDYGDLIVHLFYEPTRQYYEFDELWEKAKEIELDDETLAQVRRLNTGSISKKPKSEVSS